jgi:hypothetical protein
MVRIKGALYFYHLIQQTTTQISTLIQESPLLTSVVRYRKTKWSHQNTLISPDYNSDLFANPSHSHTIIYRPTTWRRWLPKCATGTNPHE